MRSTHRSLQRADGNAQMATGGAHRRWRSFAPQPAARLPPVWPACLPLRRRRRQARHAPCGHPALGRRCGEGAWWWELVSSISADWSLCNVSRAARTKKNKTKTTNTESSHISAPANFCGGSRGEYTPPGVQVIRLPPSNDAPHDRRARCRRDLCVRGCLRARPWPRGALGRPRPRLGARRAQARPPQARRLPHAPRPRACVGAARAARSCRRWRSVATMARSQDGLAF